MSQHVGARAIPRRYAGSGLNRSGKLRLALPLTLPVRRLYAVVLAAHSHVYQCSYKYFKNPLVQEKLFGTLQQCSRARGSRAAIVAATAAAGWPIRSR